MFRQGSIFRLDADCESKPIEKREYKCIPWQTECERKGCDLAAHNHVVGMRHESVRSILHQPLPWDDDDPCRPSSAQRHEHPGPQELKKNENGKPERNDRAVPRPEPQAAKPGCMKQDDPAIMRRSCLKGALREKALRIAAGKPQLRE